MAIKCADLRYLWDRAWDLAPVGEGEFRRQLRALEDQARSILEAGSQQSVSASGRSSAAVIDARIPGSMTALEYAQSLRTLVEVYDDHHTAGDLDESLTYSAGKEDDRLWGVTNLRPDFSCPAY